MSKAIAPDDLIQHLPEKIWFLTGDGTDIYCRRPYSFIFSTGAAATAFAEAFDVDGLTVVGFERESVNVQDLMTAFSGMQVTRVFIDPAIDPDSGDVFGTILRFREPN
jgi:hypothetical protein